MTKITFDQFVNIRLLLNIEGIGPLKIRNLLARLRTSENIINASINTLIQIEGISKVLASRIAKSKNEKQKFTAKLKKEYSLLKRLNGNLVTIWDSEYPELLKKIYDPPILLYVKGNFSENDKYSISIVGTRSPTGYGRIQAEKFSIALANQNITIVSGLARGIDSVVHKATVKSKGRTIAVLGTGLDIIYPPENKKLFEEITDKGMIITEYPLGTKPDAQNFPKRNRIISGLSLGTLVVETGINGGAMQTAAYALDQNREVFAVPGNIGIKQSEGTNALIRKGEAKLVVTSEGILEELELKLKPVIGENIPRQNIDLNIFEEKIISCLNSNPLQIDKISELTCLSTSDCLVNLLSLEFKGLVKQLPGRTFSLL